MAKYIIEFNDEANKDLSENAYYSCKQIPWWSLSKEIIKRLTPYTEPDREAIENEVWEFARGLLNYTDDDWEAIANMLLLDIPYQEAKAKYEEWKKQKEEIHVGDEVRCMDRVGIVVRIDSMDGWSNVVWEDGATAYIGIKDLTKTDRHFDEVESLLKKMGGENE